MRIYLCDISACEFWRSGFIEGPSARPRLTTPTRCARTAEGARSIDLSWLPIGQERPHVLVPSDALRCAPANFTYHVFSGKLPAGAFISVDEQICIASPELCFIEAAAHLTLPKLIELGDELCGTYALNPEAEQGFITRPQSLTGKDRLTRFSAAMPRVRGLALARRAIRHIVNASASPAETKLEMLTCLTRLLGGAGFEKPVMNHVVELPPKAAQMAGKQQYRCDLAWPAHNVAVEYNSMRYHTDNAQVTADDIRKNILEYCGMRVIVAKPYHLYNYQGFSDFEIQLARALGWRLRPLTLTQRDARVQLRKELLTRD